MLKLRTRRQAAAVRHAEARLSDIEASIVALSDDDLLDFADIFVNAPSTPLKAMAAAEMQKRGIRL